MSGEGCEGMEGWDVGGRRVEDFVLSGVEVVLGSSLSEVLSSSGSSSNNSLDWCTPLNFAVCVCVCVCVCVRERE